jgi:hypothetical protein
VRWRVCTLLASAALAVAGCGGDDGVGIEPIADAASASSHARGVRIELRGTVDASGQTAPIQADGVMDMRGGRGRMTVDVPGQGQLQEVLDGTVLYMRVPNGPKQLDGRHWARLDIAAAQRRAGIDLGPLQQNGRSDPREMLKQLERVSGKVQKVGSDDVRGTETTHYRARVDLRKVPEGVPEAQREVVRKSAERIVAITGMDGYPVDVWIDDHKLVRRLAMDMSMKIQGQDAHMQMTMDFFDYGAPVAFRLPPKDDVKDITEQAGDAMNGGLTK